MFFFVHGKPIKYSVQEIFNWISQSPLLTLSVACTPGSPVLLSSSSLPRQFSIFPRRFSGKQPEKVIQNLDPNLFQYHFLLLATQGEEKITLWCLHH
ncbi:hypothetical protein HAX54_050175 [Datura stramonium]|uniref:Uncharacterized protein n=1 Tax=Datura stramonium TaxID=4076 RepID=A0ABS8SWW4_DATST|nr:hypothetical protein [Datura stramonium]